MTLLCKLAFNPRDLQQNLGGILLPYLIALCFAFTKRAVSAKSLISYSFLSHLIKSENV